MINITKKEIVFRQVKEQLAKEYNCTPEDFDRFDHCIIPSDDKHFFKICTFGMGAVIKVNTAIYQWFVGNFRNEEAKNILDGPNLYLIENKLRQHGMQLTGQHNRYLFFPRKWNDELHITNSIKYKIKWIEQEEIPNLYHDKRFDNALSYKKNHDVLAVVALDDKNNIAAMAGADNFMNQMWQIGIDTMPAYRNQGLATKLVYLLASEIYKRGAIPYYTTWSANLSSTKVALHSGFLPAWIEYLSEKVT